ncbi:MAG: hypothetical protein V4547_20465 [Bacteroidota bacterium]
METKDEKQTFYASDRKQWRKWLEKNSRIVERVLLILYHKKSSTKSISYDEAIEEALCFGWIDSKANKRDAESYYLQFTPRSPKSKWSRSNRERVEKLIKEGLMTEQGQKLIDIAKSTGKWEE